MKPALIVALTCAVMFLAVLAVRDFDAGGAPLDEILAYQVSSQRDVEVTLHGGVEWVTITSWLLAPLDAPVTEALPYALDVRLSDSTGASQLSRRYETATRLPVEGPDSPGYEARVSDALALVSEPRTVEVDVRSLAGKAGRLRVQSAKGKYSQVLLRLAHRVERNSFERDLLARTLGSAKRQQLIAERSSLGFFDMPGAVRAEALGHWSRRLTAAGREGRDYTVRRLLIGREGGAAETVTWVGKDFASSPQRRLAVNLHGVLHLRVQSSQDSVIRVYQAGESTPSSHPVGAQHSIDLELDANGLGTALLFADPPSRLSLSAPVEDADQVLSREPPRRLGRRLEIVPDTVRLTGYRLDPHRGVTIGIAPTQKLIGIGVRSSDVPWQEAPSSYPMTAVWVDAAGDELSRVPLRVSLESSAFDSIDGAPGSSRRLAHLHVPAGATSVAILGASHLVINPFVAEQGIDAVVRRSPYDIEPPEGLRWRNAPLAVSNSVLVRPDNLAALRAEERTARIEAQVRLEPVVEPREAIVPRTLTPLPPVLRRPLFARAGLAPGAPLPRNGWMLLPPSPGGAQVVIPDTGELDLLFSAEPERLGEQWALRSGEVSWLTSPLTVQSGRRRVAMTPGPLWLSHEGLGAGGRLLLKASSPSAGSLLKRQSFYALDPGKGMEFVFERRPRELLAVVVAVASRGAPRDLVVEHTLDGGKGAELDDRFYRRTTDVRATHALAARDLEPALLWSEPFDTSSEPLPDRLGRALIQLGDDLEVGRHRLALRNRDGLGPQARNRQWVRAVLVGRVLRHP